MGNSDNKPKHVEPVKTIQDVLIEMKMQQRQFERISQKAEKQKALEFKKAQQAIQKNNEEGAKLYLQNMMAKDKEMKAMQRMAHKLEALQTTVQLSTTNTTMVEQLNKITPLLVQQASSFSSEGLFQDMDKFERSMDELMVMGKVSDELMNKHNGNDMQQDVAIDSMLNQLKLENVNSIENKLHGDNQQAFKNLQQNNAMNNQQADMMSRK